MVVEEAEAAALAAAAPMRRSTSCGTRCDIRVPEVPHVASRGCLISPRAQEVIALHDKDRGTRMKITEPKTPYHAPSTGSSGVGGTRRRAWLALAACNARYLRVGMFCVRARVSIAPYGARAVRAALACVTRAKLPARRAYIVSQCVRMIAFASVIITCARAAVP